MNASNIPKYICDKNRHKGDTDNSCYITILFFVKDKPSFKNRVRGLEEKCLEETSTVLLT